MFDDSIFRKLYKFLYFLSQISWYVFLGGNLNILIIFTEGSNLFMECLDG